MRSLDAQSCYCHMAPCDCVEVTTLPQGRVVQPTRTACYFHVTALGKFYTLTTGANEKRWGKMKDKLSTTVRSFSLINA